MFWFFPPLLLAASVVLFFIYKNFVWVLVWKIISISFYEMEAMLIFDIYSLLFFFTILFISSMIYFFSQYYMDKEKNMRAFMLLLFLFIFSMVFLIFSPNLFFLLLGWDGLGVTSYFLVVFYKNYSSSAAGMMTFLVNRMGDVFFFSSLCFLSFSLTWSFTENKWFFFFLGPLMVFTFVTKSAQLPFSSWLPAAMAAPTPVSSLVHSSTLVTAGVYLLIRFFPLLHNNLYWLMVMSLATIMAAGLMANFDWDLKKIIAFSTLSQLGFMLFSYSCSLVVFCFFHLVIHALFKASLFMCSGVVIHSGDNSQDFRNSPSLFSTLPVLSACILICLFCLCGAPFSSGFFSKDLILDGALMSLLIYFFFLVSVILTFCYSLRFGFFYLSTSNSVRYCSISVTESVWFLMIPIVMLVVFALILGNVWFESLFWFSCLILVSQGWKIFYWGLVLSVSYFFMRVLFDYFFVIKMYFMSRLWYLFSIFSSVGFSFYYLCSKKILQNMDQGWLELIGPSGLKSNLFLVSQSLVRYFFSFFLILFFFFFFLL